MTIYECLYYLKNFYKKRHCHIVKYRGKDNHLIVHLDDNRVLVNPKFVADIRVKFTGNNSTMEIFEPYDMPKSRFHLGNHDYFILKKCKGNINVIGGDSGELFIDEGSTLQNTKIFMNDEKNIKVKIGKGCMFSYDICIWASDTHQILDKNTGKLLNKSKYGVDIGDYVWCGTRTTILKDSKICSGSVIGAASTVCSRFDQSNIIIAGNPAHKIKDGITWKREGLLNV